MHPTLFDVKYSYDGERYKLSLTLNLKILLAYGKSGKICDIFSGKDGILEKIHIYFCGVTYLKYFQEDGVMEGTWAR